MAFYVICGSCSNRLSIPDELSGSIVKCPSCQSELKPTKQETVVEEVYSPPSWFLPIMVWCFIASIGALSGYVYGHWVKGAKAQGNNAAKRIVAPDLGVSHSSD